MSAPATARATEAPTAPRPRRTDDFSLPLTGREEEALLKVNLSDLDLPKVNNLKVDGLDKPWWAALLGK